MKDGVNSVSQEVLQRTFSEVLTGIRLHGKPDLVDDELGEKDGLRSSSKRNQDKYSLVRCSNSATFMAMTVSH